MKVCWGDDGKNKNKLPNVKNGCHGWNIDS